MFQIRQGAHRSELERRSQINQTLDLDRRHREDMEEQEEEEQAREQRALATPENLGNAQRAMMQMVRNNAAMIRTVEHLRKAWGPQDPEGAKAAEEEVDKLVEHFMGEVENDRNFGDAALFWTREQIKNGAPVSRAKIRRKPG